MTWQAETYEEIPKHLEVIGKKICDVIFLMDLEL